MALQRFGVGDTIRGDHRVLAAHEGNFGVVYMQGTNLVPLLCIILAIVCRLLSARRFNSFKPLQVAGYRGIVGRDEIDDCPS